MAGGFSIRVAKENFKFSAAHFIAYPGFRERLHGHNYRVSVHIEGPLAATGYVLDFGVVKQVVAEILETLNERVLLPANSDCLTIALDSEQVRVRYENDEFLFPAADVCLLPIAHSSAEELARYLWDRIRQALADRKASAGLTAMEVSVAEAAGQSAFYRGKTQE